ncbi:MAG: response regulator [Candidatus Hydrogenedentota bacterium]
MRESHDFEFSRGEGHIHILIVEDEKYIREMIAYNLVREMFYVTSVSTGESAISIARARLPNIILLDLMLPGIDGFEVCRRLKQDAVTAKIPIVIVSARTDPEDQKNGFRAGAAAYVTKPFRPRSLIDKVRKILDIDIPPVGSASIPPATSQDSCFCLAPGGSLPEWEDGLE